MPEVTAVSPRTSSSLLETNGTSYVIRLKENPVLRRLAEALGSNLYDPTQEDTVSYAVVYGEFLYKACT